MKIVWDENKNQENIKKHKVSFEEAEPEHSDKEDRFIILGLSKMLSLLVVCHCYREEDKIIRIITARKATKNESKAYGGN
jgi:uncharacterized DUF497 family protein